MSINEIIIYIMVLFMLVGAIDKCIGGKLGLSEQFEEGIMAMGALALSMAGIMVVAPLLADLLKPIIVPLYGLVGADPSIFATTFIANDMGGAPLALSLAQDKAVGDFAAYVLGSMMGPTIVFTICCLRYYRKIRSSFLGSWYFVRFGNCSCRMFCWWIAGSRFVIWYFVNQLDPYCHCICPYFPRIASYSKWHDQRF